MKLLSSVQGIATIENPNQGLNDLRAASIENLFLDLDMVCPAHLLEQLGKTDFKSNFLTRVAEDPKRLIECVSPIIERALEKGLTISLIKAPFLLKDSKRTDLIETIRILATESIKLCGKYEIEKLIVPPVCIGDVDNKDFYLSLLPLAQEHHVKLLLENQCKNLNGHFARGLFSDPADVKEVLDELGRESFGFAFNFPNMNLCGQNPYEFLTALKGDVDAVLLSDNDGDQDARLLPFVSASLKGCNVDWTNLVRGVRASGFDGDVVLEYADSAKAVSPFLKPGFLSYAKDMGDYFLWQFEMEKIIAKYPSRVLFGAGNMCRNYMLNYGDEYPPLYTCDNNSVNWGKNFEGLEVKNPKELKSLPKDVAIFICNVYYREIEAQLRDMEIVNPIERFNDEYLPKFPFERIPMSTK